MKNRTFCAEIGSGEVWIFEQGCTRLKPKTLSGIQKQSKVTQSDSESVRQENSHFLKLSESSLNKIWLNPEEDEAWQDL